MEIEKLHKRLQKIYKDPSKFLERAWGYVIAEGVKPTELQKDIFRFICIDSPRLSIIEAFRGCGKSYLACVAIVWYLIQNPTIHCMLVSASKQKSIENASFIMKLLTGLPELNHMLPRVDQRSSLTNGFDISLAKPAQSCSVYSVGLFSQLEGKRADIIIADDCEVASNAATVDQREKVLYRLNEFQSILRPPTKEFNPKIIMLGTPQVMESSYTVLGNNGYFTRIWPAIRPTDDEIEGTYFGKIAPLVAKLEQGAPTEPTRFSLEELHKRAISKSYFRLHYMLDCTLSDADRYPLKLNDLIVDDVDNDVAFERYIWCSDKANIQDITTFGFNKDRLYSPMSRLGVQKDYQECIMAIDPSGQGKDRTGYSVVKILNGFAHLIDAGGLIGGFNDDVLERLAKIAKLYKVNRIILEKNFGGGMFGSLILPVLNRIHPCAIESVTHSKQKELRIIDCLEPLLNQHRLIVSRRLLERDHRETKESPDHSLTYQLSHLTRDRNSLVHDDVLDSLSMACAFLRRDFEADAQELINDRFWDEYFQQEEAMFGIAARAHTWGDFLN